MIRRPNIHRLILAAAFAVGFIFSLFFLSDDMADLSGDSARFLLLGEALSEGNGFAEIEKPGAPPHTEYGPALPALLAMTPGGGPLEAGNYKWIGIVSLFALVILTYRLARLALPGLSAGWAAAAALIAASTPHLARFSNLILSDLPYTAMSLAALCLNLYAFRRDVPIKARPWLLAGMAAGGAFLFRHVALALPSAGIMAIFLAKGMSLKDKGKAAAWLLAGFLLFAGSWSVRNVLVAGDVDASHAQKLFMARESDPFAGSLGIAGLARRALKGGGAYFRESSAIILDMGESLTPGPVKLGLAALFLIPVAIGFARRLPRERGPMECYFLFYMLIICAWQSHYSRYLVPLVPLAIIFAFSAALPSSHDDAEITGSRGTRLAPFFLLGSALIFNLFIFASDLSLVYKAPTTTIVMDILGEGEGSSIEAGRSPDGDINWGRWYQYPDWLASSDPAGPAMKNHKLIAASIWMGGNLPKESVVLARKPRLVAYYSGGMALQFPAEMRPEKFMAALREMGATHALIDETSPGVARLFLEITSGLPGVFEPVFSRGRTIIFKIDYGKYKAEEPR